MNTTEHKPHNSQSLKGKEGCSLYPLKFKPILKSLIWGGSDICKFKRSARYRKVSVKAGKYRVLRVTFQLSITENWQENRSTKCCGSSRSSW